MYTSVDKYNSGAGGRAQQRRAGRSPWRSHLSSRIAATHRSDRRSLEPQRSRRYGSSRPSFLSSTPRRAIGSGQSRARLPAPFLLSGSRDTQSNSVRNHRLRTAQPRVDYAKVVGGAGRCPICRLPALGRRMALLGVAVGWYGIRSCAVGSRCAHCALLARCWGEAPTPRRGGGQSASLRVGRTVTRA